MNDLFEIVEDLQYAAQSKNSRLPSEMLVKWQERLQRAETDMVREMDWENEEVKDLFEMDDGA